MKEIERNERGKERNRKERNRKERSLKNFLEGSRTSVCNQKRVENFDDTSGCYATKHEEVSSLDVSRNQKIQEKGDLWFLYQK